MKRLDVARCIIGLLFAIFALSTCSFTSQVSAQTATSSLGITVSVRPDGAYLVMSHAPDWTFGGTIGQPLAHLTVHPSSDAIGLYKELVFDYQDRAGTPRSGSIRLYEKQPIILFADTYLAASGNSAPFPRLTSSPGHLYGLGYTGTFARPDFHFPAPGSASDGPLVRYDQQQHTFILSPAANFMVANITLGLDGALASGIDPAITNLPQGFTQRTILVIDHTLHQAYHTWGDALTTLQHKTRPANDASVPLNYLGYWTDTGAAYYYHFEGAKGYAGTLLAVRADFQKLGIPLGYMELDSWWYPKGGVANWQGDGTAQRGGIYTYSADPSLFPQGLPAFQQQLGLPLEVHARWIDPASPYRASFTMSRNVSTDPRYWRDIAAYLKSADIVTYQQDWLSQGALPAINLHDPQAFMGNMAQAMAFDGIAVQYCMPLPRHLLQSSMYNNVLTTRVSDDHFTRDRWTHFLYTSQLAGALGLWPWSDVFMSTETDNLLLSTLSAGVVGVGDPLGTVSKTNLLQTVRADGVVVKPDAPIVPIDAMYVQDAQGQDTPMVASTYTDHAGMKALYVFAYRRGQNTTATFTPSSLGLNGPVYVYNYFTHKGQIVRAGGSFSASVTDAAYYIVVPVGASGIAFLGDSGKFVSLGKKRVTSLADAGKVQASITFAPGERAVTLYGYAPSRPTISASAGMVQDIIYHGSTHLFSFKVLSDSALSAVLTIAD
ncbi:MAG: hypothetical protein ABI456_12205 [Ktedonobacteraceae bacterium]